MRLLIRADSSVQIGTGHVMRCLALAQFCQDQGGTILFGMASTTASLTERLIREGMMVTHLTALPGSLADAEETVGLAQQFGADWVILDGYHFDATYQQALKTAAIQIFMLDDYGHAQQYVADWVLNQNVYARAELYVQRAPETRLLLGTQYALLRREFYQWQGWQRPISPRVKHLLVTLGGTDPDNVTQVVIQALQQLHHADLEVIVLVGGSNPHWGQLQQIVREGPTSIQLRQNVLDMPALLAWADLAIAAGGTTSWELALMGVPSLLVMLAENQRAIAETLDQLGVAFNLGWHQQLTVEAITGQLLPLLAPGPAGEAKRRTMSCQAQALVDGQGVERVYRCLTLHSHHE